MKLDTTITVAYMKTCYSFTLGDARLHRQRYAICLKQSDVLT